MRISELDGLRAIAILAVFIHHALSVPFLWAGVDMFFVLSGFLITRNLLGAKEEHQRFYSHFYERRVRRLLLPYLLTILVSTVLFGPTWKQYWYYYLGAMNIAGALRLPGHDPNLLWWPAADAPAPLR